VTPDGSTGVAVVLWVLEVVPELLPVVVVSVVAVA